jgi:hypothetical protein
MPARNRHAGRVAGAAGWRGTALGGAGRAGPGRGGPGRGGGGPGQAGPSRAKPGWSGRPRTPAGHPDQAEAVSASSKIATARVQPAEALRILCGKQLMKNPLAGSTSRLCIFSMWQ